MQHVAWNAVVYREQGRWVGQVVDHDLCVSADDRQGVGPALASAIAADAAWTLKHGRDVLVAPKPAPESYRKLAGRGDALADAVNVELPGRGRITVTMLIDS